MKNLSFCYTCCFLVVFSTTRALALSTGGNGIRKRVSIVTGANGYVGRELVNVLLNDKDTDDCDNEILCLVRPNRVESETAYWDNIEEEKDSLLSSKDPMKSNIRVLPYDMLDGGRTITDALNIALTYTGDDDDDKNVDDEESENRPNSKDYDNLDICVYHVASVFGPSEDHIQTAYDNVKGTKDLVETMGNFKNYLDCNCRLVLTSSMAAVRGSGQIPKNEQYYTIDDWNTQSKLEDNNWGSSYQWSKAESERVAWEIAREVGVPMTSICPSFVFGPPSLAGSSNSFSIELFGKWVRGESPVQSRLFVDVRDVAKAHAKAGTCEEAIDQRFIVSAESRVPSQEMAEILKEVCRETGLSDASKVSYDADFQGGAIPIGEREVEAEDRLKTILGVTMTPVHETIREMGRSLLLSKESELAATK